MSGRVSRSLSGLRATRERRSQERFAERFSQQWARVRAERRADLEDAKAEGEIVPPLVGSNFAPARVPYGMDLAAAWSWRFLVVVGAGYVVVLGIAKFEVVLLPLVIALLLSALLVPVVQRLVSLRFPRPLASILTVLLTIGLVALLLTFAGQQISQGANQLTQQVVTGLDQVRQLLKSGPLQFSDRQINQAVKSAQDAVTSSNQQIFTRVTEVGTALGHIVAGFFIILFATYFFLADGGRIWSWMVRLFPRAARARADSSGRIAWASLTSFVRATVIVAFTDALGVMLVAALLGVPFVFAIGVLVFLGAFIPLIGALLSGSVAVLVALVAHGPVVALIMLGGVIAVQQFEAHVLQPFLMGRFVSIHPLGVILVIAGGVLVAGIPGALVAVPFAAALNAVGLHLAQGAPPPRADQAGEEASPLIEDPQA